MTPKDGVTQVNSGVFLMNLTRMREERFMTAKSTSLNNFKMEQRIAPAAAL